MPTFHYKAVDRAGTRTSGTLESPDRGAAARVLAGRGLTPTSLAEGGAPTASGARRVKRSNPAPKGQVPAAVGGAEEGGKAAGARVRSVTINRFLTLALRLHRGGYSIGDTVRVLQTRLRAPEDRAFATRVWEEIAEGRGFSEALKAAGAPLSPALIQMIRAGEATGNLEPVLEDLIAHLENISSVRKEVVGSLVYPAFLVGLVLVVGAFLVGYMMPKIQGMVAQMGGELSSFSRFLSGLTEVLVFGFPIACGLLLVGSLAIVIVRRSPAGVLSTDRFFLRIPMVGELFRLLDLYRVATLLASLLRNGVSTSQALNLTEMAIQNVELRNRFVHAKETVFEGGAVSRCLATDKLLTPIEGDLLEASESGGGLDAGFEDLARGFRESLTRRTRFLVNAITAVALGFAFMLVTLVAVAMVTSIFQVSQNLQV